MMPLSRLVGVIVALVAIAIAFVVPWVIGLWTIIERVLA